MGIGASAGGFGRCSSCYRLNQQIEAVMGAGYATSMSGTALRDYTLKTFHHRRKLLAKILQLRPESLKAFLAEGGLRLGEINIERVMEIFLPPDLPDDFAI
ncbi:MAG: hypothetical protein OEU92_20310 [Alphaproteobacteria bacterium]|nr:hypothetical protein [Alphaproteobacteria bacterium]